MTSHTVSHLFIWGETIAQFTVLDWVQSQHLYYQWERRHRDKVSKAQLITIKGLQEKSRGKEREREGLKEREGKKKTESPTIGESYNRASVPGLASKKELQQQQQLKEADMLIGTFKAAHERFLSKSTCLFMLDLTKQEQITSCWVTGENSSARNDKIKQWNCLDLIG